MPRTADSKPAQIVKCPHCDWKGSARGLFGHVRLLHPGREAAIRNSTKRVNPYAVLKNSSKTIGKASNGPTRPLNMEDIGLTIIVGVFLKLIDDYMKADRLKREQLLKKFQSEAYKPTTQGVFNKASI
jgi:hypothetical protein